MTVNFINPLAQASVQCIVMIATALSWAMVGLQTSAILKGNLKIQMFTKLHKYLLTHVRMIIHFNYSL
jgi:hypothetical protein